MTAYMIMADPEATFEFLKSTIITAVLANKQAKDAYTQSTSKTCYTAHPLHSYVINTIIIGETNATSSKSWRCRYKPSP